MKDTIYFVFLSSVVLGIAFLAGYISAKPTDCAQLAQKCEARYPATCRPDTEGFIKTRYEFCDGKSWLLLSRADGGI